MSPILEVLIGMVFIYSLLSILVTQINAVIANSLKLRARHLRDGIEQLVKDKEILAKVLSHPLVDMVESNMVLPDQRLDDEQVEAIITNTLKNVTWIAPQNFTNVLLNIIRVDSDQELFGALLNVIDGMPSGEERRRLRLLVNQITTTGEGVDRLRKYIAGFEDEAYRQGLVEVLADIDSEIAELGLEPDSNIALMAGLRKVKNPYLRNALSTILATSKSLEEAEAKIGQWFDNGMSRASTAFQTTMQYWSLGIGLLIAVVLNVDSLFMAQSLWNDPALRDALTIAAEQVNIADLQAQVDTAQTQIDDTTDGGTDTSQQSDAVATLAESFAAASATAQDLSELRLPLGWSFEGLGDADEATDARVGNARYLWNFIPGNYSGWFVLWLAKIIGLGATMIAIAQGAPFWFGILRRLSSGK
ncbi:MAG: hypothetical protein Q9P01_09860 [Anaerolineae bacterium]|nr:hypothetical protein [Anaerolineae bacterium]MDQ7035119.1 hypothetical protein [Anaerolineae bacterium]